MTSRVTELEVKVAFLENLVAELDEQVRTTLDRMEGLSREVQQLREERSQFVRVGDLEEEVPPHHVRP